MESEEEFYRMQADAIVAVALMLRAGNPDIPVELCEIVTDVESFYDGIPVVLWAYDNEGPGRRYGSYKNGVINEVTWRPS